VSDVCLGYVKYCGKPLVVGFALCASCVLDRISAREQQAKRERQQERARTKIVFESVTGKWFAGEEPDR